jgi:uncharacterized membrane protein
MKVEGRFMIGIAVFFALIMAAYWFTAYEDAGTVMLFATVCLGALGGSYFLWWSRRMTPRLEDSETADIPEGSGAVGAFPNGSIWPFVLGMGLASVGLALVFGIWFLAIGLVTVIGAYVGVIYESRRGGRI